jgi:hypothetical protein
VTEYTDQECMEIEIEAMYAEIKRLREEGTVELEPEPRYSGKDDPWPPPGEQGPKADADATVSGYRREAET